MQARATKKSRAKKQSRSLVPRGLKTVGRTPGLKVLKALSWIVQEKSNEVGVREMADSLSVSPSTAHRLLTELVKADYVKHNVHTGRYSLSLEFLRLAHLTIAQVPLQEVALAHMRRLTEACNETSLLGLYDSMRQEMMFLAKIDSTHPLRYSVELNKWLPVYVGGTGLAIMAHLSDAEILSIVARTRLAPLTDRTITQRTRLEAELEKIRRRGYAITFGQRTPGAVGLAAPVFGSSGEVIGDICLTIPESRFEPESESRIGSMLKACARDVTETIGGQVKSYHAA